MAVARIVKDPDEVKRYTISWALWLETAETIAGVVEVIETVTGTSVTALTVTGVEVTSDGKGVLFYIGGGTAGVQYKVILRITTDLSQVKEDSVIVAVRNT